jgi:hypothetical protein
MIIDYYRDTASWMVHNRYILNVSIRPTQSIMLDVCCSAVFGALVRTYLTENVLKHESVFLWSVWHFCLILTKLKFSPHTLVQILSVKLRDQRQHSCSKRVDGRTNKKLRNSRFSHANAPKNEIGAAALTQLYNTATCLLLNRFLLSNPPWCS